MPEYLDNQPRAFAIFGHPGHELFLFHSLASFDTEVNCFTDGSGGRMSDRTKWTRDVIRKFCGRVGPVFGEASDKQVYADLLAGDTNRIADWTNRIICRAIEFAPQYLVTDPFEYFNPVHDLANTITDLVMVAMEHNGTSCQKLTYPNEFPGKLQPEKVVMRRDLTDVEIAEKLAVVEAYEPLRHEFERLTKQQKTEMMQSESLYADVVRIDKVPDASDTIYQEVFYERYGKKMVDAGEYTEIVTLAEHYRPFVSRLASQFCRITA